MVSSDTVIPIKNGFYTVDKLNARQNVLGVDGPTFLGRIDYSREYGVIVTTAYFEITVTEDQAFLTDAGPKEASSLSAGDEILTSNGYEPVLRVSNTEEIYDMFYLMTRDGTFQANGFYLSNNE